MLQQCLITKAYWKTPEQHCYTSLPAVVLWSSFVTHSFLPPWGRNECVTNEPERTSAWRLLLHLFWLEFCIQTSWVVEGWVACYSCTGCGMQRLKKNLYGLDEEGWASLSISFPETVIVILDILSTLFLGGWTPNHVECLIVIVQKRRTGCAKK